MFADVLLIVMCKAPCIGAVKTRLMPSYSAEQACVLHQQMATTVINRARKLFVDVWLAVDDVKHPFFKSFQLPVYAQGDGDLGQRMAFMQQQAKVAGFSQVLFLGTDSPHMCEQRLQQAVAQLQDFDVVLGPVEDGGYDLIALSVHHQGVFKGVNWGGCHVLQQSLQIIQQQGLRQTLLDESFDVDFAEDVQRAKQAGWSPDDD